MDKAVAEILHQLEMIRDGDCKAELESSRIAMIDALDGVADTPQRPGKLVCRPAVGR